MFASSADANTSAGAPFWICVTRSLDPANENRIEAPGFASSKSLPSVVNVCWSEAAAKTVIEPVAPRSVAVVDPDEDDPAGASAVEHADIPSAATTTRGTSSERERRLIGGPPGVRAPRRRPSWP